MDTECVLWISNLNLYGVIYDLEVKTDPFNWTVDHLDIKYKKKQSVQYSYNRPNY